MRLVILETPYSGDVPKNEAFARACLADALRRGEAPLASHLLYTQPGVLNDLVPGERELGIAAGHAWYAVAQACVAYTNLGISPGMATGIRFACRQRVPIEYRTLENWPCGKAVHKL